MFKLFLDKVDKPKTVDYDKLVCAEIPNKKENPNLYETITRLNIHTPYSSKFSWNENGRCTKRFPKKIIDHTYEDENGYPEGYIMKKVSDYKDIKDIFETYEKNNDVKYIYRALCDNFRKILYFSNKSAEN